MLALKETGSYVLQRDFRVLEREQRVTKVLSSHAFRAELEGILQGQLEGSRSPPKLRALRNLQDNVMPAAAVEAAHRQTTSAGWSGGRGGSSVLPINDLRGVRASRYVLSERQLRCKLASLCRLVDWFGWSKLVHNHVSARGVTEREEFLINPFGLLYCEVTASSLVRVNNEGVILDPGSTRLGVNRPGVELHSAMYGVRRDVKCVMHLHTVAGAAISVMSCGLLPISEEALTVGKVSYYEGRRSLTDRQERKRLARALGRNKALILRNHGLIALGGCVEECFHVMYNLIQACQIQVAAISAGIDKLMQVPLIEGRGQDENVGGEVWTKRGQMAFEALMRMLDNKGYQTGYRYRGLSLLHSAGDSDSLARGRAAWGEVVEEEGHTDTVSRQHKRRGNKTSAKDEDNSEVWSFLDDNRSRDRPLTKNTKIRVRGGSGVSPVVEETEDRDPWGFLTSRDATQSKLSTALKDTSASSQHHTNTSGGSVATDDLATPSSDRSQSHRAAGKRRVRKRKPSHRSKSSPRPSSPGTNHSHMTPPPTHAPATLSPPPDLTPLQMAQYTAERVAHSTGVAVQKLALQRLPPDTLPERSLSQPELHLTHTSTQDKVQSRPAQNGSSHHRKHLQLDSQGYSSGDEASNVETHPPGTHSPDGLVRDSTTSDRRSTSPQHVEHRPQPHTINTPQQYYSIPYDTSEPSPSHPDHTHNPHTHSSTLHTTPISHTPADISYPNGYSSAEKAAYVARLVADSTGTAVQKLSETMSEKKHLSLSSGEQPPLHAASPLPLTDD